MRHSLVKKDGVHLKNRTFLKKVCFVKANLSNHIYIYLTVMNICIGYSWTEHDFTFRLWEQA